MNSPHPDAFHKYYAITLTATESGEVVFGCQSIFSGWYDDSHRIELREGRLVYADFSKLWASLRQPFCFVLNDDDLIVFLLAGGHALVTHEIAESSFTHLLKPHPSANSGAMGFMAPSMFPDTAHKRAPTPKLRMSVLNRDKRRCRICGRNPDDDGDLQLHVHHIRPWERGGLTEVENLVTLCHTCHLGLHPHFDPSLFDYIKPRSNDPIETRLKEHLLGVKNFRRVGFFADIDRQ